MYNIPYFKEEDKVAVLQFMQQYSFAMLIGSSNDIPVATQVPLLLEERGSKIFLLGHIMRNTDHHKALEQNNNVLCIFTGAHTYVSASWYTNAKVASTWNYSSVHAKGIVKFLSEDALIDILKRTTAHYEANPSSPASFDQLDEEYVQKMLKAIVAFEIEVTALDNVFKLSQNRDEKSYDNIVQHLSCGNAGAQQVAQEMETRKSKLFK